MGDRRDGRGARRRAGAGRPRALGAGPATRARRPTIAGDWERAARGPAGRGEGRRPLGGSRGLAASTRAAQVRMGRDTAAAGDLRRPAGGVRGARARGRVPEGPGDGPHRPAGGRLELWEQRREGWARSSPRCSIIHAALRAAPADGPGPRRRPVGWRRQPGWEARGLFLLARDRRADRRPARRGGGPGGRHWSASPRPAAPCSTRPTIAGSWRATCSALGRPAEAEVAAQGDPPRRQPLHPPTRGREAEWLLSRAYLQQNRMPEAGKALVRSGSYGAEHRLMPEPVALCRARRPACPATAS